MPYYGKYLCWKSLLKGLCTDSKRTWEKQRKALKKLSMVTDWRPDLDEIRKQLKSHLQVSLDDLTNLRLKLHSCATSQWSFIDETKYLQFPPYKELFINSLENASKDQYEGLVKFLKYTNPKTIDEVYL